MNPAAFPCPGYEYAGGAQEGMTLRDYFAAQVAGPLIVQIDKSIEATEIARQAYLVADAMLARRQEP